MPIYVLVDENNTIVLAYYFQAYNQAVNFRNEHYPTAGIMSLGKVLLENLD